VSDLARVEVERRGSRCVVRIVGEVDMSNAQELATDIGAAVPNGLSTLVVDLTPTTYLDSAGVQLLFQLAERLRGRRQNLKLIVPRDAPIRALLELAAVPDVIPVEAWPEDDPTHP
jgi:anti-anti-sigma factor